MRFIVRLQQATFYRPSAPGFRRSYVTLVNSYRPVNCTELCELLLSEIFEKNIVLEGFLKVIAQNLLFLTEIILNYYLPFEFMTNVTVHTTFLCSKNLCSLIEIIQYIFSH